MANSIMPVKKEKFGWYELGWMIFPIALTAFILFLFLLWYNPGLFADLQGVVFEEGQNLLSFVERYVAEIVVFGVFPFLAYVVLWVAKGLINPSDRRRRKKAYTTRRVRYGSRVFIVKR